MKEIESSIIDISRMIYQNNCVFEKIPFAKFLDELTKLVVIISAKKEYLPHKEVMENLLVDIMNSIENRDQVLFADLIRHDLLYMLHLINEGIEEKNVL